MSPEKQIMKIPAYALIELLDRQPMPARTLPIEYPVAACFGSRGATLRARFLMLRDTRTPLAPSHCKMR